MTVAWVAGYDKVNLDMVAYRRIFDVHVDRVCRLLNTDETILSHKVPQSGS